MKKIAEPLYPSAAEREYVRKLNAYAAAYVRIFKKLMVSELPDIKMTIEEESPRFDENIESKIARIMGLVDKEIAAEYPETTLRKWAMAMIGNVDRITKKSVNDMINGGLKEKTDLIPLMKNNKLTAFYNNVIDENVGLIRSISQTNRDKFKNQLVAMLSANQSNTVIQKQIMKNFSLSKARAALIARDQVGKLQGKLQQYRQQQIGVTRYKWVTSGDGRVRKDHRRLNGKIFSWGSPPVINQRTGVRGHPKQDFQCRCWARPVLEDLIDS